MATKIGVTGHQSLEKRLRNQEAPHSETEAWAWVEQSFGDLLTGDTIVVSSLAAGADQRLSRLAVERNARLEVVIPSAGYADTFDDAGEGSEYEALLAEAIDVIRLDYPEPSEQAYLAAGKCVVDRADTIVAVWDGEQAEGLGGTGDAVAYAVARGKIVIQLDPIRRTVDRIPREGSA